MASGHGWSTAKGEGFAIESPSSQSAANNDHHAHPTCTPTTPTGRWAPNLATMQLDLLDPQKRELLEARLMGKGAFASSDSNHSNASAGSCEEWESSSKKRKTTDGSDVLNRKLSDFYPRMLVSGMPSTVTQMRLTSPGAQLRTSPSGPKRTSSPVAHMRTSSPVRLPLVTRDSAVQTVMVRSDMEELESCFQSRDERDRLQVHAQDLQQQLTSLQDSMEKFRTQAEKSRSVITKLLLEKAAKENREARSECMKNRLRLGQFITKRQGAQYVETWQDGTAFTKLYKSQEEITTQRDELEKERRLLVKRKPGTGKGGGTTRHSHLENSNDSFSKPMPPSLLTPEEHQARDEILKLRAAAMKKEEAELAVDLEKLERERNIHIRELKRIAAEDSSKFNDNPLLHKRYLLLSLLGKGGFSEVYRGFDLQELRLVACKIHQLASEWKEDKKANYIKHALREYNIHKKLEHPNVVRLYDVFEIDRNSFCTVLEYVDGNDLDFLLKQQKCLPEKEARTLMLQVLAALKYLNEIRPPVIHYDLKPGNILLGSAENRYEAKITDFGLSKIVEQESPDGMMELTSQGAGTYWYLPPECFIVGKGPPRISSKVDVWSVGVIFYQCLYGKKPFGHNLSQASILEQNTMLKATTVDFPPKPTVSQEAKQFISRCLRYNKGERPDVLTLCYDIYLKPVAKKTATTPVAAT